MNEEEVDLACRGYRRAVLAWCKRYTHLPCQDDNKLPRDVTHLLQHVSHCVRQLTVKRKSLQSGLSCLQQKLWPEVLERFHSDKNASSNRNNADHCVALLQHFLVQCLRLHDGLFLLISGECRHQGDIRKAKKQEPKFSSQLAKQCHRPDGYTKLYNAPCGYSGYGWDELYDPEWGIQTRLLRTLEQYSKPKKRKITLSQISDYLLDHGGQALETLLDQHESEMKLVQQGFTNLRDQVVRDLKESCSKRKNPVSSGNKNVKVSFTLHDKMEKLQVGNIILERQGNAFQVLDPQGALPDGYTIKEWTNVMKLPQTVPTKSKITTSQDTNSNMAAKSTSNGAMVGKKRRRVILEESSDEENDHNSLLSDKNKNNDGPKPSTQIPKTHPKSPVAKPSTSSGLHVKVKKETTPSTPGEPASLSLAKIKTQMGADVQALEAAREEVEREEAGASKAAKAEEVEAMATTIKEGEASIRSQRRVLQRVLVRDVRDVKEIWDARELLREQLMAVGNQILWDDTTTTHEESSNENDRKEALLVALKYFQEAKTLVQEQEAFRRKLNTQGKYSPAESRFFSRNLLLLHGQAHTNAGITNIELSAQCKRRTKYKTVDSKRYLRDSIKELTIAQQFAESLRSRAFLDRQRGSNIIETTVDALRADQLESLTLRWWGVALWRQGYTKESNEKTEIAASFFLDSSREHAENASKDNSVHEALCKLGADCFYACTILAELASAGIDDLPTTGAVQEGDDLLSYVKNSLTKASDVVEAISNFFDSNPSDKVSFEEFLDENQVMGAQEIRQSLKEIEEWWDRRKNLANKPIVVDTLVPGRHRMPLPRSEVEHLGLDKLPTRIFTVSDVGNRRQKRKRHGPNPMYHKHSGDMLSTMPHIQNTSDDNFNVENEPKQCRPWGDELLPQVIDEETGLLVPKIEYPSVPPPMPPEIKAMLESEET